MMRWWYLDEWKDQAAKARLAFLKVADYFSIGLLIRTLFAPFRQISANEAGRTLDEKMQVAVDKGISRLIGFVVRSLTIIAGLIVLAGLAIISGVRLIIWPLLPVMPAVGLVLTGTVGAPWTLI
jgi:hypothetical protein